MAKPKYCSECGAENPAGAKFCSECGSPLVIRTEPAAEIESKPRVEPAGEPVSETRIEPAVATESKPRLSTAAAPPSTLRRALNRPSRRLFIGIGLGVLACLVIGGLLFKPVSRLVSGGGSGGSRPRENRMDTSGLPYSANNLGAVPSPIYRSGEVTAEPPGQPAAAANPASIAAAGEPVQATLTALAAVVAKAQVNATLTALAQPTSAAPAGASSSQPGPAQIEPAPAAAASHPAGWIRAACPPSAIQFWLPPDWVSEMYNDTYQLFIDRADKQVGLEITCGPAEHSTELAGELSWWLNFQNGVDWGPVTYAETAIGPLAWAVGPNRHGASIFTAVVGPNLNRHIVQAWGMAPEGEWDAAMALFLQILKTGEYTD